MTSGLSVTRLRGADASRVAMLDASIFPSDVRVTLPGAVWWVASDGDVDVGFGGLSRWGAHGYLRRSGVAKAYRGQGLHRRLIHARIAYARKLGLESVITYTMRDNHPSSNNLIACGFRLFEPTVAYAGRGYLYWRVRL